MNSYITNCPHKGASRYHLGKVQGKILKVLTCTPQTLSKRKGIAHRAGARRWSSPVSWASHLGAEYQVGEGLHEGGWKARKDELEGTGTLTNYHLLQPAVHPKELYLS